MKKIALFLFALSFCFSLSAQEEKIDWGPKYKHKGYYKILGECAGDIFVFHVGTTGLTQIPNFKLFKFNSDKLLTKEFKLKDVFGRWSRVIDFYLDEESIYALVLMNKGKKQFIEKFELNPSNLEIVSRVRIKSIEKSFQFVDKLYRSPFLPYFERNIYYFHSETGNKIGVVLREEFEKEKYVNNEILVFDRRNFYEELNSLEVELYNNDDEEIEEINDYLLREDGSLNLLIQHHLLKKRKKEDKSKPNYSFELIRKPLGGEETSFLFKNEKQFLKDPKITNDAEGNIYLAALYGYGFHGGNRGTALFKISPEDEIVFKVFNNSPLYLGDHFSIDNFFKVDGKFIIMYREQRAEFLETETNVYQGVRRIKNETKQEETYYRGKTIIEAFDNLGSLQWSNIIHQETVQYKYNVFSSNLTHYGKEDIMIFANMHKNNIENLNHEDPKRRRMPNDDNVLTRITIDSSGDMKFDPLCEPWRIFIGPGSTMVIGDQIYIASFQVWRNNLRLGTLPLK